MKKIGIFDSGFGGLTVLSAVREKMPEYDYLYLGDTARAPYGNRSTEEVYKFTLEAVGYLFNNGCELVILACNTASSDALRRIQQEFQQKNHPKRRVLGVVIPTSEFVVARGHQTIGVMATLGTVSSGSYIREIKKLNPEAIVRQIACPKIVPHIETGKHKTKEMDLILEEYLVDFLADPPETIILGCTHYEIIEKQISKLMPKTSLIRQSKIIADKLEEYLIRHTEIRRSLSKNGDVTILTTGVTQKFQKLAEIIVGSKLKTKRIKLG